MGKIDYLIESHLLGESVDSIIKKIAKMTDQNDHTGAAVEGAELLNKLSGGKYKKEVDTLKDMLATRDRMGHMPYELGQKQFKILQGLWKDAGKYMNDKQAKKFYGAY